MSSSKYVGYKNRYSFYEFLKLGVSVILTRINYPGAKLISYPVYMRGKKSFVYGKNLSIGYGCRFDLINTQKKTLFIGDNCEIGDYCHIVATDDVTIGNNLLCASKVFISDTSHGSYTGDDQECPKIPPYERKLVSKPVVIGNNVWIGENVVILAGTTIGDGCIIGANSIVSNKKIEPNSIVVGAGKILKQYSEEKHKWIRNM